MRVHDGIKENGSFNFSALFQDGFLDNLGPWPGASSGLGRGRGPLSKALRAGARDGGAYQGAGAGRGLGRREAGSKMEDEEVAESWEEAADSGVRRSRRPGAGPGGTWRERSLRGAGLGIVLPKERPHTPGLGWWRGPQSLGAVKAS